MIRAVELNPDLLCRLGEGLTYRKSDVQKVVATAIRSVGRRPDRQFKNLQAFQLAVMVNPQNIIYGNWEACVEPEFAVEIVSTDGMFLDRLAPELSNDPRVVLAAVRQNGLALQFASREMRANRQVVEAAVRQNGNALRFADNLLKMDVEIVRLAVQSGPEENNAIHWAYVPLKANRIIGLEAIQQYPRALLLLSPDLRDDPAICKFAMDREIEILWAQVVCREKHYNGMTGEGIAKILRECIPYHRRERISAQIGISERLQPGFDLYFLEQVNTLKIPRPGEPARIQSDLWRNPSLLPPPSCSMKDWIQLPMSIVWRLMTAKLFPLV